MLNTMNYCKLIIGGRLTRDPETRHLQTGTMLATCCVAFIRKWKTEQGELREESCFVDITAFGRLGENIAKFFAKGDPILLEGRLRQENWEDKQTGQKRQKLSMMVESFQFVKSAGDGQSKPQTTQRTTQSESKIDPAAADYNDDDDVPF